LTKEFSQIDWDDSLRDHAAKIVRLALDEDLGVLGDCTTLALVPENALGRAAVVARQPGVIAGLRVAPMIAHDVDPRLLFTPTADDGQSVVKGQVVATLEGPVRGLLGVERVLLNLMGRLSGIATLTQQYVDAVAGAKARIYDTRKTTPGWRRLEKYAVRLGGGTNHRTGLFDAILIKDNHLAFGASDAAGSYAGYTPATAVRRTRQWIGEHAPEASRCGMIVEIEVDTLSQLDEVMPAGPDIVLLDNMTPDMLREAVARRDANHPAIQLEASGGVHLHTVRAIAESGVDRISVGALTHSALGLDIALDWR
jgi:nicotinate-nucleotide pyrophosphorylase (carboxylating)